MIGAGGDLLDRSLVEQDGLHRGALGEGAPVLDDNLHQDPAARAAVAYKGAILDTKETCPNLRIVETEDLKTRKAKASPRSASACATRE